MDQRNECIEEVKRQFNHIGIWADTDIVRLIGFAEDEDDFYWHIMYIGGKEVYASMVGPFESLVGKSERYAQIENVFSLNGCPKAEEMRITILPSEKFFYSSLGEFKEESDS